MSYLKLGVTVILAIPLASLASTTIAYDDASDPVYTLGAPYHNLNGGFGLTPWQHSLPAFPAGSGGPLHAYVGSSAANDPAGPPLPDIDTFGSFGPVAWGNNADPTGNIFLARRSLAFDLPVGGTYAISYDNGDVDGQETISWGLAGNAMCQFYFNGADANYKFVDVLSATTTDTGIQQTWGGLRLTLTRNTSSTYSFQAVRLSDLATFSAGPFAFNTALITTVRTINITNNDGGNGLGHSMYVNQIEATAIPEPGSALASAALGALLLIRGRRS
jgi:hypothetical protein